MKSSRRSLRERFPRVDWNRPEPDWLSDPEAVASYRELVDAAYSWMRDDS